MGKLMADMPGWLESSVDGERLTLVAGGCWTFDSATSLDAALLAFLGDTDIKARYVDINMTGIDALDTSGAWLLRRTQETFEEDGAAVTIIGIAEVHQPLFQLVVDAEMEHPEIDRISVNPAIAALNRLGRMVFDAAEEGGQLLNFLGLTIVTMGCAVASPRRFRVKALVNQMEQTGFNALPIVGLLLFLIGIVLAYQGADLTRQFGAEILTVDGLAISVLRELGVLITAILVAGRSGSAFAAQIGTMKANEEVAAMQTFGLDPMEILVLPRVCALLITLPLLTFFADVAALVGGGVMAVNSLDITLVQFVRRLHDAASLNQFMVGLVKAPVFAFIIAVVGCYEGLSVGGSAESIGQMTTKAVVESIFLVIVADAAFSIIFSTLGI
jgi:phospholipid/cholesterol/gamma-HCH transport system permease protein